MTNPFLGTWLPASHGRQPPGMTWADWQPWQHWLAGPGATRGPYTYDVQLYTRDLSFSEASSEFLRMWARNNARRIDAVAPRGINYDIYEARRGPGPSAVGQLLLYRDLWLINFPALPLGRLWLISETCDDAIRMLAARQGVTAWCVGEPAPA